MRKNRLISTLLITIMTLGLLSGTVSAEGKIEGEEISNFEELASKSDNVSRGEMDWSSWGIYLQSGTSGISELGSGKIGAEGKTVANKTVDNIAVTVRIERKVGSSWYTYTSWSKTAKDTFYVSTSKSFTVSKGYYYRVYSIHNANSDISDSYTSGIWID